MLPLLEREVWVPRFAACLRERQPQVEQSLAYAAAQILHASLGMLPPEGAVTLYLEVQLEAHVIAGQQMADTLRDLRKRPTTDPDQSRDGSGRPSSSA